MILYIYKITNFSLHSRNFECCENININNHDDELIEGNISIENSNVNFIFKCQSNLLFLNAEKRSEKRKAFKLPRELHLRYNMASDLSRTIDYIKHNTDYDVSLIFKYFLRIMDPNELLDILNLVKIFPKKQLKTNNVSKFVFSTFMK